MRCRQILWPRCGAYAVLFVVLLFAQDRAVTADDFAASMDAVMARMHRDMMVPPTGNPDRDFAAMMIPHHQGAIDMAKVELQFGHDPVLLRLARNVVVEQQQEIVLMRKALEALSSPSKQSNSRGQRHMEH